MVISLSVIDDPFHSFITCSQNILMLKKHYGNKKSELIGIDRFLSYIAVTSVYGIRIWMVLKRHVTVFGAINLISFELFSIGNLSPSSTGLLNSS